MNTATLLRLMLLAEAVLYVAISVLLAAAGFGPALIAVAIVTLALSGRAVMVMGTYILRYLWGLRPVSAQRAGLSALLNMAATEYLAEVAVFDLVQPFEQLLMAGDRITPPAPGRLPVLLVHGYHSNRGIWIRHRARLERAGWVVATVNLDPVFASIDDSVEPLRRRIEEVCAAAGTQQLMLVCHSMGGLVARAYLRAHGTERIAKLIMLGSPHRGSRLAEFCSGLNARQMEPGSPWLATLNAPGAVPMPACTVSAYSLYDARVIPQDSARLPDARNVDLGPIGHQGMLLSKAVTRFLIEELSKA